MNHTTYTDIITFDLSEKGDGLIADVFISVERVKANAYSFGCSFKSELHRVIFHGALHLAGFKDKSAVEKRVMREMEEWWLKKYGVSREMRDKQD